MAKGFGSIKRKTKSTSHNPNNNSSKKRKTENSASPKVKIRNQKKSGLKSADINVENSVDNDEQVKWCHQCRSRKDKNGVVQCNKCQSKSFCLGCMTKWYPDTTKEEFVEACPVCLYNCNCKACLRGISPKVMREYSCSKPDKIEYSKYILRKVFPLIRQMNEEQLREKQIEANIKGLSYLDLQLQEADCDVDDDIYCDNCGAYIFDLYRNCACGYELCLLCCQDLRDGGLQRGKGMTCGWKSCKDGSIPCPPKAIGGCGAGILELKHIMAVDWVANMFKKAQNIYRIMTIDDIQQTSSKCCICKDPSDEVVGDNRKLQKEALYSPSAKEIQPRDMHHFQLHWSRGEPIIVHDVLSASSGLSWEPMVLWRAFRDITKTPNRSQTFEVNAVNCLDWTEETIDLYKFFRGYLESGSVRKGQPKILKLEDWKPSQEEWSRHFLELISCLPFKDYTHPNNGYLNVAVKLPELSSKSDMGPKMDIAYGDSVTNLHYNKSDTVNVLTHTKSTNLNKTKMVTKINGDEDEALVCEEGPQTREDHQHVVDPVKEGAMWDIFRRQDIPMLEKYLRNHSAEFRHVEQVLHPIHARIFYLNAEHKRKLKEEFGIEPWTIEQKLGDAVFIPAGCPCQVINLKSSTKVEINFVSPESLEECSRLQHELRMLPNNHRAKNEKLNIGKMMLYALDHALADLAEIGDTNEPIIDVPFAKAPEILNGDDANHTNGWLSYTQGDNDSELGQLANCSVVPTSSASGPSNGLPIFNVNHQEPAAVEDSGTSMPTDMPGNKTSDESHETVGLWRGHAVGLESKKLLHAVEHSYPNTFQGVQIRSKTIWQSVLEEFHMVIKGFLEASVNAVSEERIISLHEDLKDFERFGFDLSWAHKRLDMVEKLKFGNDPLLQELMSLEESLEPLKERLVERQKQFVEAKEMLEKSRLEYNSTKKARNLKAQEMAQQFGSDYDRVLTGHIGFGMLPGY